jgi:hypothetical protein
MMIAAERNGAAALWRRDGKAGPLLRMFDFG